MGEYKLSSDESSCSTEHAGQSPSQGHYLTLSLVRLKRTDVSENLVGGVPYGLEVRRWGEDVKPFMGGQISFRDAEKNVKKFKFSDDTHYIIRSNPVGLK